MRCEVLTTVTMAIIVFWEVTPCSLVYIYRLFRGTYFFRLQGWRCGGADFFSNEYGDSTCFRNIYKNTRLKIPEGSNLNFIILLEITFVCILLLFNYAYSLVEVSEIEVLEPCQYSVHATDWGSITDRGRDYFPSLLPNRLLGSLSFLSSGLRGLFLRGQNKLINRLHLMLELRMHWAIPLLFHTPWCRCA
jgi:hypothetical protein